MNVQNTQPRAGQVGTPMARPLKVAVIGAGMTGILAVIRLRENGITDIQVFEKADSTGGTWRDNVYPGLSCDVPSHLYRYRFEPNPDWSRRFSPGPEINAYFRMVAEKYDVMPVIRFNTEITDATWDAQDSKWQLMSGDNDLGRFDVVISCTGVLHHPRYPDIQGVDDFEGPCFHTARWDTGVDLKGRRVGIIGTGSTAIQIVPAIVDDVAQVSLFQRTPQWILPIENPEVPETQKQYYRDHPEDMEQLYGWLTERTVDTFARAVIGDRDEMRPIEEQCKANLRDNIHDAELRAKLTPDYKVACKRLIMSDTFYPAIQKPNAALVTEGIERIEAKGVRTVDGTLHELDVLVLATGFHAHDFMRPMKITGRDGITLDAAWADANEAYRSVAVPGFPNFFTPVGPNSPIGNFSLIQVSEVQLDYVMQLIHLIGAEKCNSVEPKQEACDAYNAEIRSLMGGTVWVSGCNSWYLDKNGNPALYPWDFQHFRKDMAAPKLEDFRLAG